MLHTKEASLSRLNAEQRFPVFCDEEKDVRPHTFLSTAAHQQRTRNMGILLFLGTISLLLCYRFVWGTPDTGDLLKTPPFDLRKSWAQYSPYFPVEEYKDPPRNCKVTQVLDVRSSTLPCINIITGKHCKSSCLNSTLVIKTLLAASKTWSSIPYNFGFSEDRIGTIQTIIGHQFHGPTSCILKNLHV